MNDLDRLPKRHREALLVAFGLADGDTDAARVGLAVLGLLTAATSASARSTPTCAASSASSVSPPAASRATTPACGSGNRHDHDRMIRTPPTRH
jgi:hypothetical protein